MLKNVMHILLSITCHSYEFLLIKTGKMSTVFSITSFVMLTQPHSEISYRLMLV